MYISRIFARNFRNFRSLDIQVSAGVTCFIGENNSGKTNLLYALRLLLDGSLSSYRRRLRAEDISTGLSFSQPEQIVVSVEFSDFRGHLNEEALLTTALLQDGKARLTYRFRPNSATRLTLANLPNGANPPTLTLENYSWEITGGGDVDLNTVGWDQQIGTHFNVDDLQQGFIVVFMEALRDVEHRLEASRTSPLQQIIEQRNIPELERNALIQHLQTANDAVNASVTVADLGNNLTEAFRAAAGSSYAMQVRLGLGEASFNDIARGLRVLLSGYGMANLDPSRNGLGLNNVLFVSLLLSFFERRVAEGKGAGQLLLVEEPEAHLHPQLQRVLLSTLKSKGVQVFISTHSTHVTSGLPLASHSVLSSGGTAVTETVKPAFIPGIAASDAADLERYLDATRSALLYARAVLLVEGPAELFVIPGIAKRVLGVDLDQEGIAVVPIFGTHFGAYAKLFAPGGIKKRCAIATDGDQAPAPAAGPDDDDLSAFVRQDLAAMRSANVEVFMSATTFEREITLSGNMDMLALAATEVGAAKTLQAIQRFRGLEPAARNEGELNTVRDRVLKTAKTVGKGRFAQILSKHVESATEVPTYISDAIRWLRQ